jgi:hypothetical protein
VPMMCGRSVRCAGGAMAVAGVVAAHQRSCNVSAPVPTVRTMASQTTFTASVLVAALLT